jgi:hypothetical protein
MSYTQELEKDMKSHTHKFNKDVIDATIENLRSKFTERGLGEDILDRLKANWTKTLQTKMQQNKEDAMQRQYEKLEQMAQTHKQYAGVL